MSEQELQQRAERNIGRVLRGKWRLDRVLGIGGMASVYAATHRNGLRGAVKLLHPELGLRDDIRDRFLREGYVANRVEHPGAVRVLDDDADDGAVFLVMELLDGKTVDALANEAPGHVLEIARVVDVSIQLLDVLVAAHAKNIVHRDLKPENLFLTVEGQVKILDFGIARLHDMNAGATGTKTGSLMGTPAFMSPEQALGNWDRVDGRTDLYAVGATMFVLLTGQLVHEAASLNQLLLAAMTKPARAIASVRADLPRDVAAVVDRALSFERDARWPDARAMQQALRSLGAPPATTTITSATGAVSAQSYGASSAVAHMPTEAVPSSPSLGHMSHPSHPSHPSHATSTAAAVSSDARARVPTSRAPLVVAIAGSALLLGALAVIGVRHFAASAPAAASAPSATSTASATAAAPASATPRATAEPTVEPTASASAEPAPSETASASAAPSPAPATTAPRLHGKLPSATPAKPAGGARCDPPFTVDAKGMKHAKPECL
ncbi:MAG TPA: serine/threonine-protein kinase [Byssovorax sp.]